MKAAKASKRPVAPTPAPPQPSRAPLWISFALVVGTLLIYWPVTRFQFVNFDDTDFVTGNPHVQAGLTMKSFAWAWHSEVARNWHPVTMLSHMLDCQLFKLHAGWHHLDNLLFHIANTLLLFHLLRLMTGAVWRSAFVAALFAWHPLHVESVAWIAERKDVLSTLFWLLTVWAYVRFVRAQSKAFYVLALLFFALGLMSKPMLVTVPFVLLLLDYWPLKRPLVPGLILEKIPFFVMSAVLCYITFSIQKHGGAVWGGGNLPLPARVENALISYLRYILNMFWPRNLTALNLRSGDWPLWLAILAGMVLLLLSIIAIVQRGRRPWATVGWFWYVGTLVPVIGLVQVGMQSMSDRFTYVPLIGLFIIVAWGAGELARVWRLPNAALGTAAAMSLAACMALTVRQIGWWKDSEILFKRMIAVNPNNYIAHYNLANFYKTEGRIDEAAANYRAAVDEEPNYADAHNNFGGLLLEQKRYDDAIQQYLAAVQANSQYLYVFNLANALADAASARHDTNEFAEADRAYGQALQMNPDSSDIHNNFGMTLQAQGKGNEAVAEFREAVRLKPDFELAHFNLADALAHLGKLDEAIAEYSAAIRLNPNRAESYNGLGICCAMQNNMPAAAQQFKELARLQPDNAGAMGNLANALSAQNKFDEAIPCYLAALRLDPRNCQFEFNLGLTFAHQGKRAEARAHYQQALRLNPNYAEAQRALRLLEQGDQK